MKGKRIRTLEGLRAAGGRAVISPSKHRGLLSEKPLPAAFVIGWPAWMVLNYIQQGLYIYKKGES